MTEEIQRLCIGCVHYGPHWLDQVVATSMRGEQMVTTVLVRRGCLHPWNVSPVNGDPEREPVDLRSDQTRCGHKGRWHEAGENAEIVRQRAGDLVCAACNLAKGAV